MFASRKNGQDSGSARPLGAFSRAGNRAMRDYGAQIRYVARWLVLVAPVAALIGSAVAFFLWSLAQVIVWQRATPWLLFLLPVAGVAVGLLYHGWGKSAEGGNNLIMDEIHETGGGIPGRMAPLVLIGTLATHLFGGSAGREGTAVQMGGSLASTVERLIFSRLPGWFQLDDDDRRVLLQAGVAAGFGAVFGTPITGAVFALEVLAIGRLSYAALVPCLMAALLGDWVTSAWGIEHTVYPHVSLAALGVGHLDLLLLAKVAVAAAAFGLVSTLFAETAHSLGRLFKRLVRRPWLRPALGGVIVIALTFAIGSRDYLGLGVSSPDPHAVTILSAFQPDGAQPWSWALKLAFTAVTLSSGFKGGEVTPLFFIGATLGHTLAVVMHAPVVLFAALGFIAVFAGATNTPLACTIMGIELFGAEAAVYIATAAFLAYLFSGHSGIYLAQRIATPKGDLDPARPEPAPSAFSLRHLHATPSPTSAVLHSTSAFAMTHTPRHDVNSHRSTIIHNPDGSIPLHAAHHATDSEAAHNVVHRHPHHVHTQPEWPARPIAMARVYLAPNQRRQKLGWWARTFGPTLSTEIVMAAKAFGLQHALLMQGRYGYTGGQPLAAENLEYGPLLLTMCVELIDEPDAIERFCREHFELLAGHPVIVRHVERWELPAHLLLSSGHETARLA